jgi:hypothetical protein
MHDLLAGLPLLLTGPAQVADCPDVRLADTPFCAALAISLQSPQDRAAMTVPVTPLAQSV